MKLLSLKMQNFRPFYGATPELQFSHGKKNVTLIHGTNGAGKTALLNAFIWVLYGKFTRGFLLPDQLVNKKAIREAESGQTVEAWVELSFEANSYKYILRRSTQILKSTDNEEYSLKGDLPPTLQFADSDGRWQSADRIGDVIGRILPEDLHSYFFFDGERIERIVHPDKKEREEIGRASKKLLGVEILDRADIHLNSVKKELEKALKDVGDQEIKELLEKKELAEEEIEKLNAERNQIESNIEGQENRKKEIENRLRQLDEIQGIQLRRDKLKEDKEAIILSEKQLKEQISNIISTRGYSVFLTEAFEKFNNLIEDLRHRGELPAGIKRQFVIDLLEKEQCICDRPLEIDSQAKKAVEGWMKKAGLSDVEEKANRMGGEINIIEQLIPEFWESIDRLQNQRSLNREKLANIEAELDDIRIQLKDSPKEEVSALEKQHEAAEEVINTAHQELGRNNSDTHNLEQEIGVLEKKYRRHNAEEETQKLAKRRIEAALEAQKRIRSSRELFDIYFRENLRKRITRLFSSMSFTPYTPTLTDDYSLYLLDSQGVKPLPVAASQGESQMLSLAFIGSIIELARSYHAKKEKLPGPDSSVFPLVMDSPFGSLGPSYRSQVADKIPKLASQLVVMVSNTQWRGEVEQALSGKIGKSYLLVYHTTKNQFERESIDLLGSTYDMIVPNPEGLEYTEIIEVQNG